MRCVLRPVLPAKSAGFSTSRQSATVLHATSDLNRQRRPAEAAVQKRKAIPITSLDMPWGFQQVEAPTFQYNRHIKVVRLSALRTGRLYPQEIFQVFISVTCWVDPRDIVRPGGLCQWKIPVTTGIEPANFRLVAQCLNRLSHRMHRENNCNWSVNVDKEKKTRQV